MLCKNPKTPTSHVARLVKRTNNICRCVPEVQIIPEFISTYATSVCSHYDPKLAEACAQHLYIPAIEKQYAIMESLRVISKHVDIHEIMGPLMNLMVHDKVDEVNQLVNTWIEYKTLTGEIQDLVSASMPDLSHSELDGISS